MATSTKQYLLTVLVAVAGIAAYFAIRPMFPQYWPYVFLGMLLLMGLAVYGIRAIK